MGQNRAAEYHDQLVTEKLERRRKRWSVRPRGASAFGVGACEAARGPRPGPARPARIRLRGGTGGHPAAVGQHSTREDEAIRGIVERLTDAFSATRSPAEVQTAVAKAHDDS